MGRGRVQEQVRLEWREAVAVECLQGRGTSQTTEAQLTAENTPAARLENQVSVSASCRDGIDNLVQVSGSRTKCDSLDFAPTIHALGWNVVAEK